MNIRCSTVQAHRFLRAGDVESRTLLVVVLRDCDSHILPNLNHPCRRCIPSGGLSSVQKKPLDIHVTVGFTAQDCRTTTRAQNEQKQNEGQLCTVRESNPNQLLGRQLSYRWTNSADGEITDGFGPTGMMERLKITRYILRYKNREKTRKSGSAAFCLVPKIARILTVALMRIRGRPVLGPLGQTRKPENSPLAKVIHSKTLFN
jgi:hypothetical protein